MVSYLEKQTFVTTDKNKGGKPKGPLFFRNLEHEGLENHYQYALYCVDNNLLWIDNETGV